MKFHIFAFLTVFLTFATSAAAQVDSVVGQVTNSLVSEAFAGGISGDGRFIQRCACREFRGNDETDFDISLESFN